MPWYKFYADHGPGHQSQTERFEFFAEPLSEKERESYWAKFFDHLDSPIGQVRVVPKLSERIWAEKIKGYRQSVQHATKMLHILGDTCPFQANGGCAFC